MLALGIPKKETEGNHKAYFLPDQFCGIGKCGPQAFGLIHPYCSDSGSGEVDIHRENQLDDNCIINSLIPVEFAMDTEMQSEFGNTTQETLAYYLKSNYFPDICVVNVGIHDMDSKV